MFAMAITAGCSQLTNNQAKEENLSEIATDNTTDIAIDNTTDNSTSGIHEYKELLSVPYGEDGLVFAENANSRMGYGPNAFYPVNDNDIYIMDSMVKTVRHYIGGKLADSVKLETDESTGAFIVGEEGIIYAGCSYNGRHYLEVFDKEGKQLSKVNAGSYEARSLKIIGKELILNDDMNILVLHNTKSFLETQK